ncbi:hypothetical protein IL38_23980 [Actinopolyspora erythraea]|uniref:Uncharacterized protein n=1 Tax=Actinopolyspora erythraea TaxID=414996 RepID=A0ABR4WY96_9ACTN|nr:hypothetical protein IL38_23980 [Actinopolyspora erythraea]
MPQSAAEIEQVFTLDEVRLTAPNTPVHAAMEEWADETGQDPASERAQRVFDIARSRPDISGSCTPDQRDLIIRASGHLYTLRPSLPEEYCAYIVRGTLFATLGWPSPKDSRPRSYAVEVDRRVLALAGTPAEAIMMLLAHSGIDPHTLPTLVRTLLTSLTSEAVDTVFDIARSDSDIGLDAFPIPEIDQWVIYRNT